jgi:serine/threonine protein phosphatase PrpC
MGRRQGSSPAKPPDSSNQQGVVPPLELAVAKLTDVGRARPHNEDYVDYYIPPDPRQLARKGAIYLVADGMGGHQAGEVASQGAVELAIGQYYSDAAHDIGTSLVRAFRAANQQIYEWAQADPSKSGMGTTLVAAVILGRKVYVANVGDSRAYLVNHKGIRQITEDHSWVEEQVRAKILTPEEARRHPQRNVVTRALGSKPAVEVDLFEGAVSEGDTLVLCTDGLSGLVEDREIATIVTGHSPEEAAQLLVAQANERGGTDNIGVVIVSAQKQAVPVPAAPAAKPERKPIPTRNVIWMMGGLAGVLLAALLVLGGWLGVTRWRDGKATRTAIAQATARETVQLTAVAVVTEPLATTPLPATGTAPLAEATTPVAIETLPALNQTPGATPAEPTATLKPTEPPSSPPPPTSTPTRRSTVPTATKQPTNPPQQSYPAPTLVTPEVNASLHGKPRFEWQYNGPPLKPDQAFDVRIWSKQNEWNIAKEQRRGATAPTDKTEAEIELAKAPAIQDYGAGDYYWAVVVVHVPGCYPQCSPTIIGEWGEERPFTYAPPGPPPEKPPPEEPTPRP